MFDKNLVLDTCALLWLASDNPRLTFSARQRIEHATIVFVSAISAWEISLKVAQKTLSLPLEPGEWFKQICTNHHLEIASLEIDILVAANNLPPYHKDPADRFIIATALREKASIVTADGKFQAYGVEVFI